MDDNRLVEDNIRLVYHLVKQLGRTDFVIRNKEDITSEGMIGLIKAAQTFDENKKIKFATYASRCIMNQMLMYIRKCKYVGREVSLNAPLSVDENGNELTYSDIIPDESNSLDNYIETIDLSIGIKKFYNSLTNQKLKRIFKLRSHGFKHREIAAKVGFSQSYVSRILNKLKKQFKEQQAK